MSGSSGSFSFGGSSASTQQSCDELKIRTQLASPVQEVIEDLRTGDILEISLGSATGPVIATHDGKLAGSILTSDPGLLINCINNGFSYQARVISITGGDCQVSIYCTGS